MHWKVPGAEEGHQLVTDFIFKEVGASVEEYIRLGDDRNGNRTQNIMILVNDYEEVEIILSTFLKLILLHLPSIRGL